MTTQDNTSAEIQSGFQIPYQTRVNFTTTVTYVDATLRLSVTPQITEAGTVIMDIQVQKNEPATGLADRRWRRHAAVDAQRQDAADGARRRHVGHRRHLSDEGKQRADAAAVPAPDSGPRQSVQDAQHQHRRTTSC